VAVERDCGVDDDFVMWSDDKMLLGLNGVVGFQKSLTMIWDEVKTWWKSVCKIMVVIKV